jgi:hypothetical protein
LGTEKIPFDDREQARAALVKVRKWLGDRRQLSVTSNQ